MNFLLKWHLTSPTGRGPREQGGRCKTWCDLASDVTLQHTLKHSGGPTDSPGSIREGLHRGMDLRKWGWLKGILDDGSETATPMKRRSLFLHSLILVWNLLWPIETALTNRNWGKWCCQGPAPSNQVSFCCSHPLWSAPATWAAWTRLLEDERTGRGRDLSLTYQPRPQIHEWVQPAARSVKTGCSCWAQLKCQIKELWINTVVLRH